MDKLSLLNMAKVYNKNMKNRGVKDEKEDIPVKFDWDTFDLDKFFKDAKEIGRIIRKRDKLMGNDD